MGQKRLSDWLKVPSAPDAIRLRQEAVAELKPQLEWRQQVEALAYVEQTVNQPPDALIKWAAADMVPMPGYLAGIRFVLPAITLGLFVAWVIGYVPGSAVLLGLALHGLVLSRTSALAKEVSEQTFEISAALKAFQALFQQAEQIESKTGRLLGIRQALTTEKQAASEAIGQLGQIN